MKTVRAEYRAQAVVSAPASEKWDLFIWRFPGDSTPVVYRSQAASTGPVALGTPGYININPLEVVSTTTNTFTSDTATYWLFATGTGLLDTGAGSSGQVSYVYPTSAYESFRHSYASITCYLTAAALSDEGTVYAAQNAPDYVEEDVVSVGNVATSGIAATPVNFRYFTTLPYDETDMAVKNPRYYVNQARNGVYMPLRLSGPNQPFSRFTMRSQVYGSTPSGGSVGTVDRIASLVSGNYGYTMLPVPFLPQACDTADVTASTSNATAPPGRVVDSLYPLNMLSDNTNVSLVIFRGLDADASVTIKYIAGMEFEVDTDSALRQFAKVPPKYDPRAIEAYYCLTHELKDAYPASWNSLGTIAAAIASVAQTLWPIAKPYLASMLKRGMQVVGGEPNLAAQQVIEYKKSSPGNANEPQVPSRPRRTKKKKGRVVEVVTEYRPVRSASVKGRLKSNKRPR
jgi:hypothetical protein